MLQKSENTITRILAAAETLFVAKNYADVTMDQIAEASRVTKGALYHHFSSKEELYLELLRVNLGETRALFRKALKSKGSCRERLRRLTAAFFDLPRRRQEIMKLVRRDINVFGEPARARLVRSYQTALPKLVEHVIRDGIRDGELALVDPRLLSWHYVAMLEVARSRYACDLFSDAHTRLDNVLDLFFRGAAASEPAKPGEDE